MPQMTEATTQINPNDFFRLINDKKDRVSQLPESSQKRLYNIAFKKFLLPKLTKSGIQGKDLEEARTKFTNRMMGQDTEPLSKDFGKAGQPEPEKPGVLTSAGVSGYAKLAGMVGHLADWDLKLDKLMQPKGNFKRDAVGRLIDEIGKGAKQEEGLYDVAAEAHPTAAKVGAIASDVAASGPAFKTGGIAAQAIKNPLLRGAVGGALGGAASSPLYGGSGQDVLKNAAIGGVGGAIFNPLMDMLAGRIGSAAGKIASRVASPKAVASGGNELDQLAQKKFGKPWGGLAPQERQQLMTDFAAEQRATQAEAQKGTKSAKAAPATQKEAAKVSTAPADSPEKSKWRQEQYKTLRRSGIDPRTVRDQVHAGKSAQEILAAQSGAKAQDIGTRTAATGIALQETPEVEKAARGVSTVSNLTKELDADANSLYGKDYKDLTQEQKLAVTKAGIKTGSVVTKVPEGQHGSGKLGQNAKKAEREAAARASAAAAQPSAEVGYEGSGKEGKGAAVPITPTQVPLIDALSGIKTLKIPGYDGAKMFKLLEGNPKFKAMPDEEKRAALEKMYQAIGDKYGIEGAENMSLDELYVRLTSGR